MRKRHDISDAGPGQDSFLDVIANLVGILIILVMVVGIGAQNAYIEAAPVATQEPDPLAEQVSTLKATAGAVQKDVYAIAREIRKHDFEIAYRQKERDKMLQYLVQAERGLLEEKQKLSSEQQRQVELQGELTRLQNELQNIERARDSVANEVSQVSIIEHLPTPMAKTVFGKEVHFRLMGGRLAYVPWEDLVERFKNEAKQKVWKLKDTNAVTEEAGPVGGFRIRYTIKKVEHTIETKAGVAVQQTVELDFFELVPVSDDIGEPVELVMQENSQFQARLANENPQTTTITIWVYPDSFEQFHVLKAQLYKRGFLTAARPLPPGRLIGGSPRGTRSAAE